MIKPVLKSVKLDQLKFGSVVAWALSLALSVPALGFDLEQKIEALNVDWDTPGPTSAESMPLGNGDIGLNVWTEPSGDLLFYISKTDAWSEDVKGSKGLLKLGAVRISMNPRPLTIGTPFRQVLRLARGEILVTEGKGKGQGAYRVWVDANNPVIHAEFRSDEPRKISVILEESRKEPRDGISADVILHDQRDCVVWYHRNQSGDRQVANLTFGGSISGQGLISRNAFTLESSTAVRSQEVSIVVHTATAPSADSWLRDILSEQRRINASSVENAYKAHCQWWNEFWNRSWIFVEGDEEAREVTEGYVLQRFITACAGRGAYPIKFNGSIFNVDNPNFRMAPDDVGSAVDADFRRWGGQYWFQNTRAMYWPLLFSGDFEAMLPLFKMYAAQISSNREQVEGFYKHGGAYIAETAPFWGGLKYVGPEIPEGWTDHYFSPILELSMMMLDYYEYTGDLKFAKDILVPTVSAGIQFYDEHFPRDKGKILLSPVNSIETYWKVRNPAPDIAGLHAILPRMVDLPGNLTTPTERAAWEKLRAQLPALPMGKKNGKKILLPYEGPQTARIRNGENPELYAIYPFRLYGVGQPEFETALASFNARRFKGAGCWSQDPVQAAMVGLADLAKEYTVYNFRRRDPGLKFPAFWLQGNDYGPDEDNGGNGQLALQHMLMQVDGRRISLLPAWPKGWNANFKLNAPYRTTVEGWVQNGKIVSLTVSPPQRRQDVVIVSQHVAGSQMPLSAGLTTSNVKSIFSTSDMIVPLSRTVQGRPNTLAPIKTGSETVTKLIDNNLESKSLSSEQDMDGNPPGVNTGFVVEPSRTSSAVTAVQIATANDMPDRDPLGITIEGSDDPNALKDQGGRFTLLYDGPSGINAVLDRKKWGAVITFKNERPYQVYRILFTQTRGDGADGTQASEVRLGTPIP